tara:strand:- start:802 stop:1062 length:261 start_codon:yes stop_codon:yes gene_type:complete
MSLILGFIMGLAITGLIIWVFKLSFDIVTTPVASIPILGTWLISQTGLSRGASFIIVMLIVLAITIVCYNIYQKALEKNYRNNIHL